MWLHIKYYSSTIVHSIYELKKYSSTSHKYVFVLLFGRKLSTHLDLQRFRWDLLLFLTFSVVVANPKNYIRWYVGYCFTFSVVVANPNKLHSVVCRLLFLTFSVVIANPKKLHSVVYRLLFLTFSVVVANPKKLHWVVCRLLFLTFSVVVANPKKLNSVVYRLLFITFSVVVANPSKLLYTVASPGRGLLTRDMYVCIYSNYSAL